MAIKRNLWKLFLKSPRKVQKAVAKYQIKAIKNKKKAQLQELFRLS